jgi:hypothetical protein
MHMVIEEGDPKKKSSILAPQHVYIQASESKALTFACMCACRRFKNLTFVHIDADMRPQIGVCIPVSTLFTY